MTTLTRKRQPTVLHRTIPSPFGSSVDVTNDYNWVDHADNQMVDHSDNVLIFKHVDATNPTILTRKRQPTTLHRTIKL